MNEKKTYPSTSAWMDTVEVPKYEPLEKDIVCDVAVVGAGIAGLTAAYLLAKVGKKVVVLDKGPIGCGQTSRTTAHLVSAFDDFYEEMERLHGKDGAKLLAESHTAAIDQIEKIVKDEGIECDFQRLPGYWLALEEKDRDFFDNEYQAAKEAGLDVERTTDAPVYFSDTHEVLVFKNQGQFHPMKYLSSLAECIVKHGGAVYTQSHVTDVKEGEVILKNGCSVEAKDIVLATNNPINDRSALQGKQAPYRSYVIGAKIPKGALAPGLYWDTLEDYHYVRLMEGKKEDGAYDILIVGGEDHPTGEASGAEERYQRLNVWTRKHFPEVTETVYEWSGQVMEPLDGLAFIGKNPAGPDHTYIVTADSGQGMTHGTLGGMITTDLILGRENPWAKLYDPGRVTPKAAKEYISHVKDLAKDYGKWLTPGDEPSEDQVPKGEGCILRHGAKKMAVYRDENGKLHRRSAVCPHMGCLVAWNGGEKSFDCPCHGSRFDRYGQVINGPASTDLEEIKD